MSIPAPLIFSPAAVRPSTPSPGSDRTPHLDRDEEAGLIRRCRGGDRDATERLIAANIRLIYKVARRYRCRSYTLDDLVQEGVVGLMAAIERFDESRGFRLSTYALHWVRQSIARAVEQNDRLIHMPAQATTAMRRLTRLQDDHQRDRGCSANETDLARASGLAEERVTQLLCATDDAVSLESLVGAEQDTSLLDMAEDTQAINPENWALIGLYREHLRRMLNSLRPREQWVVMERYGIDGRPACTLDELSRRMSVSRERVRQIETRAIQKLRCLLRASQWD